MQVSAMFTDVRQFAIFNAKPHLFTVSKPSQTGTSDANSPVFISLVSGCGAEFAARVGQFGGVTLYDE